jgi:hemoglobin
LFRASQGFFALYNAKAHVPDFTNSLRVSFDFKMKTGHEAEAKRKTLFERLGGENFVVMMLNSFFDELCETPDLQRFFRDAPVETIKTHQAKLFRCLLGPEEQQPKQEDVANYMLMTHTRLFREAGLDATHFDLVAKGFVQSLESFQVEQGMIDECVALLVPLRAVFEYGAQVAAKEKEMGQDLKKKLPECSAKTIGTDTLVVLPEPPLSAVPSWLKEELKKISNDKTLRDWTAFLSDRCSAVGDKALADLMMDIPYLQLEPYMNSILQLALVPDSMDNAVKEAILKAVRHPRGLNKDPLPQVLYVRLIVQFEKTCDRMDVNAEETRRLVKKLRTHVPAFPNIDPPQVFGLISPHPLAKVNMKIEVDTSLMSNSSHHKSKKRHGKAKSESGDSVPSFDRSSTTGSTRSTFSKTKHKLRLWFGGLKATN